MSSCDICNVDLGGQCISCGADVCEKCIRSCSACGDDFCTGCYDDDTDMCRECSNEEQERINERS